MADVFDKAKRSEVMGRIRSKDTKCEILVRKALWKAGLRFRLHDRELPGTPDIVLPASKIAIQVRGCFWHGHTCGDGRSPTSNTAYWNKKLRGNRTRDRRNDAKLRRKGWALYVIWECSAHDPKVLRSRIVTICETACRRSGKSYFSCGDCMSPLPSNYNLPDHLRPACPECGSKKQSAKLFVSEGLAMHSNVRGKLKSGPGRKGRKKEFFIGDDLRKSRGDWISKSRTIDYENDVYREVVTDRDTNKIIHKCHEPLSRHKGHGSAKKR